jgi:hypothetical protein
MAGTEDKVIPLANAEVLARLIPHARLFTIEDGHLFLITRADEVARVVMRFLAERVTRNGNLPGRRGIRARVRGLRRSLWRMRIALSPCRAADFSLLPSVRLALA